MTTDLKFERLIFTFTIMIALTIGVGALRSQGMSTTTTFQRSGLAISNPKTAAFYIKIGGLEGQGKGYSNNGIECHGFNSAVEVPDRLKPGTYTVQFADASGKPYFGTNGQSLFITSKQSGLASGKRAHSPISITKQIDNSSPLTFSIGPNDVDEDGMVYVMITVRQTELPPGAPIDATPVISPSIKN